MCHPERVRSCGRRGTCCWLAGGMQRPAFASLISVVISGFRRLFCVCLCSGGLHARRLSFAFSFFLRVIPSEAEGPLLLWLPFWRSASAVISGERSDEGPAVARRNAVRTEGREKYCAC